jgi:BMFP domain-containing protein YqiC
MIDSQFLENLSIRIREIAKSSPTGDLEKNLRALLQGAFTKLELVSREEFDVQTEVLRLTREKLEALEAKVGQLEKAGHAERQP